MPPFACDVKIFVDCLVIADEDSIDGDITRGTNSNFEEEVEIILLW